MNDKSGPKAALVHAATALPTTVRLGNETGRQIRRHRRMCRQLDDLLGIEHYPHPDQTVPAISMREAAA